MRAEGYAVAQLGARMHYAVPRILADGGALSHFYTDICAIQGWPRGLRLLPAKVLSSGLRRLAGRVPVGVPSEKLSTFTSFGWEYARRRRRARTAEETTQAHLWAGAQFNELILRRGLGDAEGVYTFNGAGLLLLAEARRRGLRGVMEQTIAPVEIEVGILDEEAGLFPDWEASRRSNGLLGALGAREATEWQHADRIVCGSEFVRQGIHDVGGPVDKCVVVPYGVDAKPGRLRRRASGPLKVLFVGAVGLRKGVQYIKNAAEMLSHSQFEFRLVGSVGVNPRAEAALRSAVSIPGPTPRSEMSKNWEWADVFLLPSLCEGSATVCYEALAAGLPVITTPNAGSVVRDGVDGFIVPIRDGLAIAERLERLASEPGLLEQMSANALETAREFTVEKYATRLLGALRGVGESKA